MSFPNITRRTELGQSGHILGQFADANQKFLAKSHKKDGSLKDFEDWTDVPWRSTRFSFSGTGSWGVDQTDVAFLQYARSRKRLRYQGAIIGTDVTAPLGTELRVDLPDGMTCANRNGIGFTLYNDAGGANTIGICQPVALQKYIKLLTITFGNWTATAADNTNVYFDLELQIL